MVRSSPVLIVGRDAPLTTALAAGLTLRGWAVVEVVEVVREPVAVIPPRHRSRCVVLVEDQQGNMPRYWSSTPHSTQAERVVIVGGVAAEETGRAVDRGAVAAFNVGQPVAMLVTAIDEALSDPRQISAADRNRLATALRDRGRHAALFTTLTTS